MSHPRTPDPEAAEAPCPAVSMVITPRDARVGAASVRRVLPYRKRRSVGPFVFFDHFGPTTIPAGEGMDVRPHPHIHLATVTWLFAGEVEHRDSVGSHQIIRPGAINWMHAGRGIVHSERSTAEGRERDEQVHGLQLWVGLPTAAEDSDPHFAHHAAESLPACTEPGVQARVLVGEAHGLVSPVQTASPTLYVAYELDEGASIDLPDATERALYAVEGRLELDGTDFDAQRMLVLTDAARRVTARAPARFVLIGGDPLDGERFMWWNFVSSDKAHIEAAKQRWRDDAFDPVQGDDGERTPLPE